MTDDLLALRAAADGVPDAELTLAIRRAGVEVDDSLLARQLYSSDASLYRIPPRVVVLPRHRDEIAATLAVARDLGVPITARGAGTSIAGNAVGPGIVIDHSRHLGRVLEIDPLTRSARVEPGTVHAALQRAATPHGLRFGPDPSTHTRCTIGGMIGNNACGSRALGYGRTADNVLALDVLTGTGERLVLTGADQNLGSSPQLAALRDLRDAHLATIRQGFGLFPRQVSGYSLEHLLPERGFDVARMLVGSEGTLALVQEATVRLVEDAPVRILVVLGYADMAAAADATPGALPFGPVAAEGMDRRIVDRLRASGPADIPELPSGNGWLLVELVGDDVLEVTERARRLVAAAGALDAEIVTDARTAAALWKIREDGAGLSGRTPDGRPCFSGWEDAAVPTERLGDYLREFDRLLEAHGVTGVPYGHFGDGCVHIRIDFPLGEGDDRGRALFRTFLEDAAALVARYGGSLSGEHGDGRARSALLPHMYSPDALALQAEVKRILDPEGLLNPGNIVDPDAPEDHLRTSTIAAQPATTFRFESIGGFAGEVHRCTGVGKCRAAGTPTTVMCPSYQATKDEKDSTRGRARVLQEMLQSPVPRWDAPEVHDALDLCLSCKGCSRDCPTGIDMATYKAEVLDQTYRGRRRPLSHYTLGRLPVWADLASRVPRLANAVLGSGVSRRFATVAGVSSERRVPAFARHTFHRLARTRPTPTTPATVALWVDSFTNHFSPEVAVAAVRVLEAAGHTVEIVADEGCCGLTWISTGQLDAARRMLGETVTLLGDAAARDLPIVGLEPSCTAVLRHDAVELLGTEAARVVSSATRTLAEVLAATPGWEPPDLTGLDVVAQPHCHHHAVMGWETDADLLARAGAKVDRVGGCCGLAGNWGVDPDHHDLSVEIAEQQLLPAVRALPADGIVLADGFSCRTQLEQTSQRRGIHLAELLAQHL
ncbi:FAD-binding and (Fe-S)-binding domain-containing protein [Janibacter sp. G1551]|uniref:FAD-binding and (Fe-S)-binding domain-containing protein n=1 Tax=Janibacter sp. G1551 TaxID=3420440 RepID=UPI003D040F50